MRESIREEIGSGYYYWKECRVVDYELQSFRDILDKHLMTKVLSIYLWNEVLPKIDFDKYSKLKIRYRIKRARHYTVSEYTSSFKDSLIHDAWIYDSNGQMQSASQIALENLATEYKLNNELLQFLKIEKKVKSIIELGGTKEQQDIQDIGKMVKEELGDDIPKHEIIEFVRRAITKEKRIRQKEISIHKCEETGHITPLSDDNEPNLEEKLKEKWEKKSKVSNKRPHSSHSNSNSEQLLPEIKNLSSNNNNDPFFDNTKTSQETWSASKIDDTAFPKKFTEKQDEALRKAKDASDQLQISNLLNSTEKYTYKWYKLLMELMHANRESGMRSIQIDFSNWEFIGSDKILRLENPSKVVPSWISEAEEYSIVTIADKSSKVEGQIIKCDDKSIDLSIEKTEELTSICSKARKIRVNAKNSTDFIDSFERRFLQLGFEDDYNMCKNLPSDITFIYGPPGTGKTTKVIQMVNEIISKAEKKTNILILTPTNKAADVVAEKMVDDEVCFNYLTRFGSTESMMLIEDAAVFCNRDTTDMDLLSHNILVTTAARYAYDCVQPNDVILCDYQWDYIIIDEASMMDILTVTYILYKGNMSKFIISGDPMQIQPVSQNDMPSYSIYDLVDLHSFSDAVNNYRKYPVIALQTQYRSIQSIGNLVSKFSYNGLVKNDPDRAPQKPLVIDGLDVQDINFIGFTIGEFNLVTELTAINGSAFHLYSAIFTYKCAEYIANQIAQKYNTSKYSIGIVCPYKAESDSIKQMLESRPIPNDNCSVSCGTVHSFQGDECDIMFVVLNPPAQCGRNSHINNHNIINVAMSRARDYLFFVLPAGQSQGFYLKNDLGKILSVTQKNILKCSEVENVMFGDSNHICSNTHVTCHMPVNVYCEESATYEVRMSDEAIDIKINQ